MIYTLTLNPAIDYELVVADIALNQVLRASATRSDCGGKGFNVSRMLAALGAESVALGLAGGGGGAALRSGLAALGISAELVSIAAETRTNVSVVDQRGGRHLKVNAPGPTVSAAERDQLVALVRARARAGDWWVLAGSLPPGIEPAIYAELIAIIERAGARAALDASGPALAAGWAARPTLVKPNASELAELAGRPITGAAEALAAARALPVLEHVVISLGAAGALLIHAGGAWIARPPAIAERSAVGAGDALVAGLIWGLQCGDPIGALRWGVACGAATAGQPGSAVGTIGEVRALAAQVEITALA